MNWPDFWTWVLQAVVSLAILTLPVAVSLSIIVSLTAAVLRSRRDRQEPWTAFSGERDE